jgi:AraC-like DNA-binding protein
MAKFTSLKPHPILSPFVSEYVLVEFNTIGNLFIRPWFATHEFRLVIFLKDKPLHIKNNNSWYHVAGSHQMVVVGQATRFNGLMTFNGDYSCLIIQFQPNGFHQLFGHPPQCFINQIISADDLFDNTSRSLVNQLQNLSSFESMAYATDSFLMKYLTKKKLHIKEVTRIAAILKTNPNLFKTKNLALRGNLSTRSLERQFLKEVGMTPKFFCRLVRFDQAVNLKVAHPNKSWSEISFLCGYYDSVHFNKNFKEFTDSCPSTFFTQAPLPDLVRIVAIFAE